MCCYIAIGIGILYILCSLCRLDEYKVRNLGCLSYVRTVPLLHQFCHARTKWTTFEGNKTVQIGIM